MFQRNTRRFSIKEKFEAKQQEKEDTPERRIHFRRIRRSPQKLSRPIWWLFILGTLILMLFSYLKRIG
ncbi:MAG: hypothetical protein COT43_04220 [Candidatus Marinimicrobia bacterium CG08_land_8_20_14_0_20_45_22]|nr:MAG: hypothetical protein COT43_04220 [Candidatus Marinimicrobia bacterium CG08_land_8_20_14_0_20_45_22]